MRGSLAQAVRRAAAGERTLVTLHGRPVAQLAPLDEHWGDMSQLVGAGAVLPPRRTSPWRAPVPVRVLAGTRIDVALRDVRG